MLDLRAKFEEVVERAIAPLAEKVDAECLYPKHSLDALAAAGLMGLHVPQRLGSHELGLTALITAAETIGKVCPSSAMCYAMHSVGTAVIAAKPTRYQEENYLRPIAAGKHVTTLSLSESGTGVHFYLPATRLARDGDGYVLSDTKQFVTNGGHADSYVVSTLASSDNTDTGEFSCVLVDRDCDNLEWLGEWRGFGMRGNSSRGLKLDDVKLPLGNLLSEEGDQVWYAFEVVAPYFLMAMAGTYLGIAQAALEYTLHRLRTRVHEHSGETLAQIRLYLRKLSRKGLSRS